MQNSNRNEALEAAIKESGLANLASALSRKSGETFSPQQINHWRTRGVPYRWQDLFVKVTKTKKADINRQ